MSQNQLAVLGQPNLPAPTGGRGLDLGSKLFNLKPATLSINQPNTQADGAIKGKLRIIETGDQFDEMFCAFLVTPEERRQYYLKQNGELSRNPENLMCFSNDAVTPSDKSKVQQAFKCHGCPKASWDKYRQSRLREDIPPCDDFYHAILIDTTFKMPLRYFVRSTAKRPFEQGFENIARRIAMLKAQGKNPDIFDIGFKLSVEKTQKGQTITYLPKISDVRALTEEEKASFGEIYAAYTLRNNQPEEDVQASAQAQVAQNEQSIDNLVSDEVIDGEIVF